MTILKSTSVFESPAAPSISTLSAVALQTIATAPGTGVASPSAGMSHSSPAAPPPPDPTKVDVPPATNPTPANTASKTAETSVQRTSGGPASTVVSVTVIRATALGGFETSTITSHPASTLSKPSVLTITDSNGSRLVTTPPLVTLWSTSTESDGSLVTSTSVVSNVQQDQVASESGIFRNPGAVAGIFSVVGVVLASLVICMVFWICHRRTRQRNKWLVRMQPKRSFADDPFYDGNAPPAMRSVDNIVEDDHWDQKGILAPPIAGGSSHGHQTFGLIPAMYPMFHDGSFNQPEKNQLQVTDVAPSTEPNWAHFRHSWTPSTPSIYPASLSPGKDEHISDDIALNLNRSATVSNLPPRPPRSHLRERVKTLGQVLPTPESESSTYPSPISESQSQYVYVPDKNVRSRLITP